ncbi:uncharacterized protein [Halyomorpha halys]|uniref:uncharacterized protein n=1 Tax=Halyomorpha halys TaxID=286706 RepID=UPI0006D4E3E0|nr:zinc finger protein ZFP69-like [Halyomorpha halys]
MATENDLSTTKHIIDENQYNYLKETFWELMENGYTTDIKVITDKDVSFEKKVHGIILQCFCELSECEKDTENCNKFEKTMLLHHAVDMIECVLTLLYIGKCIVPVTALPQFMDLANSLKISQISVYDERGSDYFIYLMHHKQKLLNYLCHIRKNDINCDLNIVAMEMKCLPVHSSIMAVYSKRFLHCFKNRIKETNPVLLFLPLNEKIIALTLELSYFGQVTFAESTSHELTEVANLLGMERFLEKCKLSRKRRNWNEENDFRLVKPPGNSKPDIIDKIKKTNSQHYVYIWTENRCYIFPFLCIQLLNFLSTCNDVKENQFDIIVFLKNISNSTIKKFISSLYTWEFKNEIKLLIDLFGLKWPTAEDVPLPKCDVYSEVPLTTLYANNLDDFQSICHKVFKEECSKGEKIIQLFTCQICGGEFLSWRAFKIHGKEHRIDGYLCEECGQFVRPNIFFDHAARHKALRNNECEHCLKQFPNAYRLKQHHQFSSCILEKCTICNKRVRKLKIKEHIAKHNLNFQCVHCKQNFSSSKWLERHMIKLKFQKPVECVKCKKKFVYRCHLKEHFYKEHHPVKCSICFESFRSTGMLNRHFMIKHTTKRITCCVCDKIFTSFATLKVHERFHNGEEPFECRFCDETFRRFDTMQYHIQHMHEKRKYICPVCKNDYSSRKYFLEHGWINHQKSFDPDLCIVKESDILPMKFTVKPNNDTDRIDDKINLQNDVDYQKWLANKNIITYSCPICRATFTSNFIALMFHLDTHLDE